MALLTAQMPGLIDLAVFIILISIGIALIVLVVKLAIIFLPAAIIAAVVWFLTNGNLYYTGIAFLAVALLSMLKR